MAIEYFCCYHSYLEAMEELNDAEKGRLFTACLMYSMTGEAQQLKGNERFVFPAFRAQIDRDNQRYDDKCKKQSDNAKKRWDAMACDGMPSHKKDANDAKEKEKEKAKEKANNNKPLTPCEDVLKQTGFSPVLQTAFEDWIKYKTEKRKGYTPTGLKSLITEVRNNASRHGEDAVAKLIRECMAANYQGIIFDRLDKPEPKQAWKPGGTHQRPVETKKPGENANRMRAYLQKEVGNG